VILRRKTAHDNGKKTATPPKNIHRATASEASHPKQFPSPRTRIAAAAHPIQPRKTITASTALNLNSLVVRMTLVLHWAYFPPYFGNGGGTVPLGVISPATSATLPAGAQS
jgi:hypothetical protein